LYIIIAIALLAALIECRGLFKQRRTLDIWICAVLLTIGLVLGILESLYIPIPSPLLGLKFIFGPIHAVIAAWFK
jgi:hypothetical protein